MSDPRDSADGHDSGAVDDQQGGDAGADTLQSQTKAFDATSFCAGLVSEKSRLHRNFTRSWQQLKNEFAKSSPSRRYLTGDLQRAEELVRGIRDLVERQKEVLVLDQHEGKLLELEEWEKNFDRDLELLADVSSFLEQPAKTMEDSFVALGCDPGAPNSGRDPQRLPPNMSLQNLLPAVSSDMRRSASSPAPVSSTTYTTPSPVSSVTMLPTVSSVTMLPTVSGPYLYPVTTSWDRAHTHDPHNMARPSMAACGTHSTAHTGMAQAPPTYVSTGYHRAPISSMPLLPAPHLGFQPYHGNATSLNASATAHSHGQPQYPAYMPTTPQAVPQVQVPMPSHPLAPRQPMWPAPTLSPLKIPKFTGLEEDYLQWRQRFLRAVDHPWASDDHKLDRLRESLEGGKADVHIAGVLDGPGAYQEAWQQLETWYGGLDRHLERQIRAVMAQRKITDEMDLEALQAYAVKLQNTLATLRICGSQPGPELYILATERVPREVLMKFFQAHGEQNSDVMVFCTWFVNHLRTLKRASDRVSSQMKGLKLSPGNSNQRPSVQGRSMLSTDGHGQQLQCRKCQKNHVISECPEYLALPVVKRWDLARLLNLCVCCLNSGHWAEQCGKSGCSRCPGKHNDLLHRTTATATKPGKREAARTRDGRPIRKTTAAGSANVNIANVAFMTMAVGVRVCGGKSQQPVTALLDSGSNCSYVTEELAARLNLTGPTELMETAVLGGDTVKGHRQRVVLRVCHDSSTQTTPVEAWVIPQITTGLEAIDWNEEKRNWPHLSDIDFMSPGSGHVQLLIGLDAAELHASYEERRHEGGPIARRTPMGWIGFGPQSASARPSTTLLATHPGEREADSHLHRLVTNLWDLEAVGMNPPPVQYLTPHEKEAEQQTERSMRYDGQRFEMGIPWLHGRERPDVSCNQPFAERRLNTLVATFAKKPDVKLKYAKVLEDYLQKGYIRHVPEEEVKLAGLHQWFLPHFPVVRNDKETTKVRVVFDAAAEHHGVSLNSQMHVGPKLQNDLVVVLLRFCAYSVALAGDISEMFLQVKLRAADRQYHRFVWRDALDSPIKVFEFLRLAFGIRASPYLAGRALKATAEHAATGAADDCSGPTREAIEKDFYVDDFLHSLPNENMALARREEVQRVVAKGGFQIRKWSSNSAEVLDSIPFDLRSQAAVNISDNESAIPSKTLGVTWSPQADSFSFNFSVPEAVDFTRRGVLRQFARLFDPRGQLQPFTIRSRVLFQEICIRGKDWDEPLDEDHCRRWQRWFNEFPDLSTMAIQRSFRSPGSTAPLSLHTYTDASEFAYAAATYVREDGDPPRITLAMARARPSPIKRRSIPMLELQGAVLGVRLAHTVASALEIDSSACHFWTDSMNVLYWVRSPSRKFKMDVGRRISEIQEQSVGSLWQHVPGRLNPADKATRGLTASQLAEDEVWFHGPQYLLESPEDWPNKQIIVPPEMPGMNKNVTPATFTSVGQQAAFRLQPDRYSSWRRLTRVTAWCLRIIRAVRVKPASSSVQVAVGKGRNVSVPELSPEEIECAEHLWINKAQQDTYPMTCQALSRGHKDKSGKLIKLQPVMDTASTVPLLRVGGRLKDARHLPSDLRSPIILPRSHRVTELIVRDEDERCGHAVGTNHLLSNLSTRFWIVKGRAAVKSQRNKCVLCKKR